MSIGGKTAAATVFVDVEGDLTKFRDDLKQAGNTAQQELGGGFQRAAKVGGTALATASAGVLAGAAKTFVDFEKGISEVYTLLPDASSQLRDQLADDAKSIAAEFGQEFGTVTTAMYDSISAGVDPKQVEGFLADAGKLAIAGATDIGTAVDGLTGVLNAYGYDAGEAGRISDVLFGTVKAGKTTVDELAGKVAAVTPIASNLGLSFEQVGAAFATVTSVTGNTAEASTQLRSILAELSKDGQQAFKNFEQAAGKTFPDFIAEGGNLGDALVMMQEYAEENGKSLGDMFGSVEAGGAALILAADGATTFGDNLAALEGSAGSTDEAFGTMSETLAFQFDKIKAELKTSLLEIGVAIAPTLATMAEGFAAVAGFLGELPGPVLAAVVGFAGLAGALLALSGPILRTTQLVKGLFSVLSANPYLILIAATVAIAILIYKNWDEIKAFLVEALDAITGAISSAWEWIKSTTTTAWNAVKDFLAQWWPLLLGIMTGGIGLVVGLIIQNWDSIKAKTVEAWDAVSGKVGDAAGAIKGFVEDYIVGPVEALIGFFTDLPNKASTAWEGVKGAISRAKDGILSALGEIGAAADRALGPLDEIAGFAASGIGKGLGLLGFNNGGVVPGPIGAPRLVLAHGGETFIPTHQRASVGGGAGGDTYLTVELRDATIRNDDDIVRLARMLADETRRVNRSQGGR